MVNWSRTDLLLLLKLSDMTIQKLKAHCNCWSELFSSHIVWSAAAKKNENFTIYGGNFQFFHLNADSDHERRAQAPRPLSCPSALSVLFHSSRMRTWKSPRPSLSVQVSILGGAIRDLTMSSSSPAVSQLGSLQTSLGLVSGRQAQGKEEEEAPRR